MENRKPPATYTLSNRIFVYVSKQGGLFLVYLLASLEASLRDAPGPKQNSEPRPQPAPHPAWDTLFEPGRGDRGGAVQLKRPQAQKFWPFWWCSGEQILFVWVHKKRNCAGPTRAYASCVFAGFQPTRRQFLRKSLPAYENCAGTLIQPTRLALQKTTLLRWSSDRRSPSSSLFQ